jgi:hypothetical protein
MPHEPALLTSAGRMPERSQHRVSEGQDARSERPATGHGQPRTVIHSVDYDWCFRQQPDRPSSYERFFRGSIARSAEGMGRRVS